MQHLQGTVLDTLAAFVLLPAMLGLAVSMGKDALRRDRRGWVTGAGWMDELSKEDK